MEMIRWNPRRELSTLRREMDRLLDEFFQQSFPEKLEHALMPVLDLIETKGEIIVRAEIPGVDENDISITLSGNILSVMGDKKRWNAESSEQLHRGERSYGAFRRVVILPASVDAGGIMARYEKGILEVRMPKKEA